MPTFHFGDSLLERQGDRIDRLLAHVFIHIRTADPHTTHKTDQGPLLENEVVQIWCSPPALASELLKALLLREQSALQEPPCSPGEG